MKEAPFRRPMAEINVTPFVDVMLVLLIIFMVTAPFLQGGFEIDLPKVAARGLDVREGLIVTVRVDQKIAVGNTVVTFDKLEAGWRVVSSALTVRGVVPGMSREDFVAAAEATRDGCPISVALAGNVALSVEATLEG